MIIKKDKNSLITTPARLDFNNPYIHLATSENTRKAYRSDIRHYETWGGKLPATSEMIADYLHYHAAQLNPRTLARRLIAIKHWHTYQGFSDPTEHVAIKKTMVGIIRSHGKPKIKASAITPEELFLIHEHLKNENTLSSIRDDALLQVAYFGAFRRSELANIRIEDITWEKTGIIVLISSSKTDQRHLGQYCAIPFGNKTLCPITALKNWLALSGINEGWVFKRIYRNFEIGDKKLTGLAINHILKKHAKAVGINNKLLSSHSLRRGLATSAARAGASLKSIMQAGRWKQTNTVMEYIEESERFEENAAKSILQKMTETTE